MEDKKRNQTISNDGVNSQKRQRTRSQRISDTLAKKKTQRIIGGVIGGLVAANVAMYGIGYYQKHSGKTKKMRVNSEEAKKKAKMAEEWYERIKNGQSYFDARNNLNYGSNTRSFTFRKNRYSLPKFN